MRVEPGAMRASGLAARKPANVAAIVVALVVALSMSLLVRGLGG